MASESVRAMKEKIASDNLFKAKAVGETQAETDAFKCGRCQQRKCTYYQMQTRSADEPMTVSRLYTFYDRKLKVRHPDVCNVCITIPLGWATLTPSPLLLIRCTVSFLLMPIDDS
jgi:hypothetical protein